MPIREHPINCSLDSVAPPRHWRAQLSGRLPMFMLHSRRRARIHILSFSWSAHTIPQSSLTPQKNDPPDCPTFCYVQGSAGGLGNYTPECRAGTAPGGPYPLVSTNGSSSAYLPEISYHHHVLIAGLQKGNSYYYRCGDWSTLAGEGGSGTARGLCCCGRTCRCAGTGNRMLSKS